MSEADKKRKGSISDDDFDSDVADEEMDEELALPQVLVGISNSEKRELLRFKHTHNERDWEEEVLRRSDLLARKIDMERLKNMSRKGGAPAAPAPPPKAAAPAKGKRKAQSSDEEEASEDSDDSAPAARGSKRKPPVPPPQPAAGQARRGKMISLHSESEEEEGEAEKEEEGEASEASEEEESEEDSDNDDDLFDSEEEEEITKRVQDENDASSGGARGSKKQGSATRKVLGNKKGAKKPAVSTRSSRSANRSKYESEEESEDEEGDEEEELYGKRLGGSGKKGGKTSQFGYEDDGEDVNLSRIKEKNKSARKGYDSDGSGGGGRGGAGAKKTLSVQEQMKAEVAALMLHDDSPPAELVDYWTIQPRRTDMIMKWLNEPFLKSALENYYVRFAVGDYNNKAICRMCKIVGVDLNGRPYKLAENGETCTVRLTLMIAGVVRKQNRVCQVSNSRITPDEFKFYFDSAAKASAEGKEADKLLTKNQVKAMRKLFLSHTVQHVYTDTEIKDMVKKSIGLDKSKVTEYSTAMESLQKKLAIARETTDYEALEVVQKTIELVQKKFADEKEKFDKSAAKALAVNRKMKESNVQRDMAAGNRLRAENLEAVAKGVQSKAEADPFSRRETRPKILWNTGKKLEDARMSEGNNTTTTSTAAPAAAAVSADTPATVDAIATTSLRKEVAGKPVWRIVEPPSLDQIRRRVKQRLGVDPVAEAARSTRERYLSRVCARLPALGSAERAALRESLDAKSLEDALEGIEAGAAEAEAMVVV